MWQKIHVSLATHGIAILKRELEPTHTSTDSPSGIVHSVKLGS